MQFRYASWLSSDKFLADDHFFFFFSFNVDSKINNSKTQSESFKNRNCCLCAKAEKCLPLQHRVGYTFCRGFSWLVCIFYSRPKQIPLHNRQLQAMFTAFYTYQACQKAFGILHLRQASGISILGIFGCLLLLKSTEKGTCNTCMDCLCLSSAGHKELSYVHNYVM